MNFQESLNFLKGKIHLVTLAGKLEKSVEAHQGAAILARWSRAEPGGAGGFVSCNFFSMKHLYGVLALNWQAAKMAASKCGHVEECCDRCLPNWESPFTHWTGTGTAQNWPIAAVKSASLNC